MVHGSGGLKSSESAGALHSAHRSHLGRRRSDPGGEAPGLDNEPFSPGVKPGSRQSQRGTRLADPASPQLGPSSRSGRESHLRSAGSTAVLGSHPSGGYDAHRPTSAASNSGEYPKKYSSRELPDVSPKLGRSPNSFHSMSSTTFSARSSQDCGASASEPCSPVISRMPHAFPVTTLAAGLVLSSGVPPTDRRWSKEDGEPMSSMSLAPCRDRESRTSVRKMTAKELVQQLQQVTSTEGFQDESVPSADLLRPQKSRSSNLMERRTRLAPLQIPAPKPQAGIKHLGDGKIYDLYYWDEVLQESGDGGKVVVCKRKGDENGPNYVMKIRSKESLRENYYEEEFRKLQIRMLNFPPHVGIMPLHEVYEDENFYYTVMKKATGSFFHSLVNEFKDGVMPHRAVKSLMRDILEAVDHVHKQGMLHRDIKPDNLVMQDYDEPQSPTGTIKKVMLIDFDHADAEYSPKTPKTASSQDICGTLRFNAPETFLGEYSTGSDLYSVGTILYLLMTGRLPYDDDIFDTEPFGGALSPNSQKVFMRRIYEHMQYQPINFDCEPWPEQSDCRDFCMRMLSFDPSKRIQLADEALQHCWFSNA